MSTSPTGPDVQDVVTAIASDAWVAIDNPNMSKLVNLTSDIDVYVKYQSTTPGVAEVTFPLWSRGYLTEQARSWLGYNYDHDPIPGVRAIWVRPITSGATGTVYAHFRRE